MPGWAPVLVPNEPPRSTQPGHPSVDRQDEYQRNCRTGVALAMHHRLCDAWPTD